MPRDSQQNSEKSRNNKRAAQITNVCVQPYGFLALHTGTRTLAASFFRDVFGGKNMTYEDPQSGRERNLGQDAVGNSSGSAIIGIVFLAAVVFGGWYFYNHTQKVADTSATQPATSSTADNNSTTMSPQSSGPGVQGEAGGKNGPSAQPESSNSSTGASSGNTGVGGDNANIDKSTVPTQDSTGVKGAEGNKNGPAATTPSKTNP
jgi:hypothetical protein